MQLLEEIEDEKDQKNPVKPRCCMTFLHTRAYAVLSTNNQKIKTGKDWIQN